MRFSRSIFSSIFRYTKTHEYIEINSGKVGITKHAADNLGDILFVSLPEKGIRVVQTQPVVGLESVKAVTDVYTPVKGTILDVNHELDEVDGGLKIRSDPQGDGWLFRIKYNHEDTKALMTKDEYDAYIHNND